MKTKSLSLVALAVLAACGGGGGSDDASPGPVAAAPPASTPAPAPAPASRQTVNDFPILDFPKEPPPVQTAPIVVPAPVVAPVNPAPVAAPPVAEPGKPDAPPIAQPPAPPPQPAEGTYIPGSVILKAMTEYQSSDAKHEAFPTEPLTTAYPDAVSVSYWAGGAYFSYDSYPVLYRPYWERTNFDPAYMQWDVNYNTGNFALGQTLQAYSGNSEAILWRATEFVVKSDDKFILNQTFAEWKGVAGTSWFVQLQVQDYNGLGADPKLSTAAFSLCVHHFLPEVRRLSCTIHDRTTGQFRGVRVVDDSDGLGPVEWLPKR